MGPSRILSRLHRVEPKLLSFFRLSNFCTSQTLTRPRCTCSTFAPRYLSLGEGVPPDPYF